jgi:steroid 5-alpha reductase family enzyme
MFEKFSSNMICLYHQSVINFSLFILTWILSIPMKNAGLTDCIWGLVFVIQAITSLLSSTIFTWQKLTFASIVVLHGLHLSIYILTRTIGSPEDRRFTNLFRDRYGKDMWWKSLFAIYLKDFFLTAISGFPIYAFLTVSKNINNGVFIIGSLLMFIGSFIESIADIQLYKFKLENRDKLYFSGLWKYCRHPNYFGECLFWIGLYVANLSAGIYFTIFSPVILIYYQLW